MDNNSPPGILGSGFEFGYSRSLGWDVFNLTIEVMAYLVAAGLLVLMLAVVGAVRGARARWDLRS